MTMLNESKFPVLQMMCTFIDLRAVVLPFSDSSRLCSWWAAMRLNGHVFIITDGKRYHDAPCRRRVRGKKWWSSHYNVEWEVGVCTRSECPMGCRLTHSRVDNAG